MRVGAFGDIVFEVSDHVIRTFQEVQRTNPGRWAVHEVMGSKPISEFIGPGLDEITLPIHLNELFLGGNDIEDEVERIRELVKNGTPSTLVIADRVIGKFYLESLDETHKHFGGKGESRVADLSLKLKEYIERTA